MVLTVSQALRRLRQEDQEFLASLAYIVRPGLKKKERKEKEKEKGISQD
jgi:hypothetical protein